MVIVSASVRLPSLARKVTAVLPTGPAFGHENVPIPFPLSIKLAVAGRPVADNVSVPLGCPSSLAMTVNVRLLPKVTVLFPIGASTGALLTGGTIPTTVMLIVSASLRLPSLALKVVIVLPTGLAFGQEKVPIPLPLSIKLAPSGKLLAVRVSVPFGWPSSLALTVNVRSFPRVTVLLPIGASTGALLAGGGGGTP